MQGSRVARVAPLATGLVVCLVAGLLNACSDSSTGGGERWPGLEWELSTPEGEGMDATLLDEARAYAFQPAKNTQGVVVVRNGAIVVEWYADATDASLATSWSVGKSFASTLIGIAVDRGDLPGIDVPIADFLPAWQGTDKGAISLRQVLQMRSGVEWNELVNAVGLYLTDTDQLAFALDRPAAREPGITFNYSSGDSMLYSGVIETASGQRAGDYARQHLFEKIGMRAEWWTDGSGHSLTYCCLDATSREFARFGLLFARGGRWRDEQVVSRAWVDQATTAAEGTPFYGLQWWTNADGALAATIPHEMFSARGLHSQLIYVLPSLDLVVVRTGWYRRVGDAPVRTDGNLHMTLAPDEWSDDDFLGPIVRSIGDAAAIARPLQGRAKGPTEAARRALESAGLL